MKIHIVFGQRLDGVSWSRENASLGELVLGPMGMLSFLEGRHGLSGNIMSQPERINQYRLKYENYLEQRQKAGRNPDTIFGAESFKLDPWSTAKQLLAWRDELIEGMWSADDQGGGGRRMETLASLEHILPEPGAGQADRLRLVLARLETEFFPATLQLDITLHEPLALFPMIWQRILKHLETLSGCAFHVPESAQEYRQTGSDSTVSDSDGDHDSDGKHSNAGDHDNSNDNSNDSERSLVSHCSQLHIICLEGNDELELAQAAARYLAAQPNENGNVTLICSGDSQILDGMLVRYGFGAVGSAIPSSARPTHAILPLVLDLAWKPFRPDRFLDLLQLPISPIPYSVRYRLIDAMKRAPGMKNECWDKAWKTAMDTVAHNTELGEDKRRSGLARLEKAKAILEGTRFSPDEGIPTDKLVELCDWTSEALPAHIEEYPELKTTMSHIKTLKAIALTRSRLKQVEVLRILNSILGTGTVPENVCREVTPFEIVTDPGMILRDTQTLLWFNFVRTDTVSPTRWYREEQEFFGRNHIYIDSSQKRKLDTWLFAEAISKVSKQLILFMPRKICGETAYYHPFLYDLLTAQNANDQEIKMKDHLTTVASLIHGTKWKLADRELDMLELPSEPASRELNQEEVDAPCPTTANTSKDNGEQLFTIPETSISPQNPFSFTQLSHLLGCPFRWVLEDYLSLRKNEMATESLLLGNLAHKLFETLFSELSPADIAGLQDETIARRAEELFEDLTLKQAMELNYPEKAAYRAVVKDTIAHAACTLARQFSTWNITQLQTEQYLALDHAISGHKLNGRVDLIATDAKGTKYVIDYKWSWGKKYSDQADTCQLQLATYVKLLG
ncbi:MAG: PD-(D/E)XK nuclease family protein [Thermoguttaceae bacterium]|nr:PD-(D/E)XK nuclease family protein [Thermoguttaceae bacterium]